MADKVCKLIICNKFLDNPNNKITKIHIASGCFGKVNHTIYEMDNKIIYHFAEKVFFDTKEMVREVYNRKKISKSIEITGIITHYGYNNKIIMKYYNHTLYSLAKEMDVQRIKIFPLILKQLCHGLHIMSLQNLAHNDINPKNILVNYSEGDDTIGDAVLGDLGSVTEIGEVGISTYRFQSPEIRNKNFKSKTNDIFSLGLSMIEFLNGCSCSVEKIRQSPHLYLGSISPKYKDVLIKMVQPDKLRYRSVSCILSELSKVDV
jgi:serine/threonine protein kinase